MKWTVQLTVLKQNASTGPDNRTNEFHFRWNANAAWRCQHVFTEPAQGWSRHNTSPSFGRHETASSVHRIGETWTFFTTSVSETHPTASSTLWSSRPDKRVGALYVLLNRLFCWSVHCRPPRQPWHIDWEPGRAVNGMNACLGYSKRMIWQMKNYKPYRNLKSFQK